jgi:hypothetical protein
LQRENEFQFSGEALEVKSWSWLNAAVWELEKFQLLPHAAAQSGKCRIGLHKSAVLRLFMAPAPPRRPISQYGIS